MEKKQCKECLEEKTLEQFNPVVSNRKTYRKGICKSCESRLGQARLKKVTEKVNAEREQAEIEKIKSKAFLDPSHVTANMTALGMTKLCKTCQMEKSILNFSKGRLDVHGNQTYKAHCKVCANNSVKELKKSGAVKDKKKILINLRVDENSQLDNIINLSISKGVKISKIAKLLLMDELRAWKNGSPSDNSLHTAVKKSSNKQVKQKNRMIAINPETETELAELYRDYTAMGYSVSGLLKSLLVDYFELDKKTYVEQLDMGYE